MTKVNITADALVVLRADKTLAEQFLFEDPTAAWFITEQGKAMAQMAQAVDPAYVDFNMSRYHYFEQQLSRAFEQFKQILILGSGYDTRAIRMAQDNPDPSVFEIDLPEVIESKQALLVEHDLKIPTSVKLLSADLSDNGFPEQLKKAGFDADKPTFVMIEGVVFFLPSMLTDKLFCPRHLNLAPGSELIFDFWCKDRVDLMNALVSERIGKGLFHAIDKATDQHQMSALLNQYGYQADIKSLQDIAQGQFHSKVNDLPPQSWLLACARL